MAIRVAMVSFWHVHARDYARQATEHPETEIVGAWDEDSARGKAQADELGVPFYQDLDDLLAQSGVDGVIIDTPTNMHHEVMIAAAEAGKHIFTEKVVAATLHECKEIIEAVDRAEVKLTVSLPHLYRGYTHAINELVAGGALGDITLVRSRISHNGALRTANNPGGWLPTHFFSLEQCRGGALIDLGCHPMYLTRLFLGEAPESVSATYGYVTGRDVEDNAVATLKCANGALGVVEAGFVSGSSPFSIEVHGTDGSLYYGAPDPTLRVCRGGDWTARDLPEDPPTPFAQWVAHIQHGTRADDNIHFATELTRLMEAANTSADKGRSVSLSELEP
jgi:1,5-anhydro-D-fructose reductase (1,5-anhydro-D-mannitol-forming)